MTGFTWDVFRITLFNTVAENHILEIPTVAGDKDCVQIEISNCFVALERTSRSRGSNRLKTQNKTNKQTTKTHESHKNSELFRSYLNKVPVLFYWSHWWCKRACIAGALTGPHPPTPPPRRRKPYSIFKGLNPRGNAKCPFLPVCQKILHWAAA